MFVGEVQRQTQWIATVRVVKAATVLLSNHASSDQLRCGKSIGLEGGTRERKEREPTLVRKDKTPQNGFVWIQT